MSKDGLVNNNRGLQAIVWDYDGTLVDSRQKGFNVNRVMIADITGRPADDFPALRSLEAYQAVDGWAANWRELYMVEFGMTEAQTDEAGRLWTKYQLKDNTPVEPIKGIPETVVALGAFPQGIVSQNGRAEIQKTLNRSVLDRYFGFIVGYEEVDSNNQKPAPTGLIACLDALTGLKPGVVCYIGDFETDAQMAIQANAAFKEQGLAIEVIMIGAFYGYPGAGADWSIRPDYAAYSPAEVLSILAQISN